MEKDEKTRSFQEQLSRKLRDLRKQKRLTQQEVADQLQMKRSTYTYYETGKSQPNLQTLVKLADFFEVTTDYLLK